MPAYSSYKISLAGERADIEAATTVAGAVFHDKNMVGREIIDIVKNDEVVWVDDVSKLAEKMVRAARGLKLMTIVGTVDTGESAGEYMDFLVKYEDGKLSVQSSCWYLVLEAGKYANYEDFCKAYSGCTEEVFEILRKGRYFMLDSGNGGIATEVPLDEAEEVDLDCEAVYLSQKDLELPSIPVSKCECGTVISIEKNNDTLFPLYVGTSLPVACAKCGKKYKLFLD